MVQAQQWHHLIFDARQAISDDVRHAVRVGGADVQQQLGAALRAVALLHGDGLFEALAVMGTF